MPTANEERNSEGKLTIVGMLALIAYGVFSAINTGTVPDAVLYGIGILPGGYSVARGIKKGLGGRSS